MTGKGWLYLVDGEAMVARVRSRAESGLERRWRREREWSAPTIRLIGWVSDGVFDNTNKSYDVPDIDPARAALLLAAAHWVGFDE